MDITAVTTRLEDNLKKYNVQVSPQAKKILAECIVAIVEDPHPDWESGGHLYNERVQEDAISSLTLKLTRLFKARPSLNANGERRQINTFEMLHHISSWVDHLCPFEKPAAQPAAQPTP